MCIRDRNLTGNMVTSSCNEVIKKINRLNQEYQDKQPVIIEIESLSKKSLTIWYIHRDGLRQPEVLGR